VRVLDAVSHGEQARDDRYVARASEEVADERLVGVGVEFPDSGQGRVRARARARTGARARARARARPKVGVVVADGCPYCGGGLSLRVDELADEEEVERREGDEQCEQHLVHRVADELA